MVSNKNSAFIIPEFCKKMHHNEPAAPKEFRACQSIDMAHSVQLLACWVTLHAAVQKDPDFNFYIRSYLPIFQWPIRRGFAQITHPAPGFINTL